MRLFPVIVACLIFATTASAQKKSNQIGLRLGDPLGVTYKRFISEKSALEFIVGTAAPQWNQQYYIHSFESEYHNNDVDEYVDHKVSNVLYLQARYLHPRKLIWNEIPGQFDWHWGVGVLAKKANLTYDYNIVFKVDGKTQKVPVQESFTDYDFGPEGILGVQYTFANMPFSISYDFSLMFEFYDRPGVLRGFTALSFHYNF